MSKVNYNLIAAIALVGGIAVALTSIVTNQDPIQTVALASPFIGIAGTVVGRGTSA